LINLIITPHCSYVPLAMSHNQPNQTFYLDQSTLQCKNQCGFFGNPEWFGYCSICFKQLSVYSQQNLNQNSQQNELQQLQYYQQQHRNEQQMILRRKLLERQQENQKRYQEQQQLYFLQSEQQREELSRRQQQQLRDDILAIKKPFQKRGYNPSPSQLSIETASNEAADSSNCDRQASSSTLASLVSPSQDAEANLPVSPHGTGINEGAMSTSSNLFGSITSPTSLVQIGYDTLSNLHTTILNTAKSSFRSSPSSGRAGTASGDVGSTGDSSSVHSTSQSEYQIGRKSGSRAPWSSIISPHSRKASLSETNTAFHYDMAWVDCLNQTNRFAKEFLAFEKRSDKSINDLSDMVHEFYEKMAQRFETQHIYKGAAPDQLELLNDNMEMILNEHIYHVISTRIINEDEDHNMAIQKRIRSLNWITTEHLEIEIDFQRPTVHDLLDKAICQMVEMNSRTSSIDKLECIVKCSKTIFELLQDGQTTFRFDKSSITSANHDENASESNLPSDKPNHEADSKKDGNSTEASHQGTRRKLVPASADQFLPVLVFVVIQANPPMLPADMKYLTRFSNPRRLMSGETGYYFTNLCCALEFIEKATGASLNISEEDFNRYTSGEAVPDTRSEFHTYLCDGLRTMCANDAALKKLKERQEARSLKMNQLMEQIDVHIETNRAKQEEMERFSSTLRDKLQPSLPTFFEDIKQVDSKLANRLLPSKLRSIDLN